jgi:hypothetical protein
MKKNLKKSKNNNGKKNKFFLGVLGALGGSTVFLSVFLPWVGSVHAQTVQATPVGTPVTKIASTPNMNIISQRVIAEINLIHQDRQSGKLTKAQAQALWSQITSVFQKEQALLAQSGAVDLGSPDMSQLTPMLDSIDSAL